MFHIKRQQYFENAMQKGEIAGDSSHEVPSHDANEFYAVTRRRSFTCQVKNAGQCHDELVSGVLQ